VQQVIQRVPTPSPPATDDLQKTWDNLDLSQPLADLKAVCADWEAFAKRPATNKAMWVVATRAVDPLTKMRVAFERVQSSTPDLYKQLGPKANGELGAKNISLLTEMIALSSVKELADAELIFNIPKTTAGQVYTLKMSASGSLPKATKQIVLGVSFVEIGYSNAFGWKWTQQVGIAGLQLGCSVSAGVQLDPADPTDPDFKGGGSAEVGPLSVSLEGTDNSAIGYDGYDDLNGLVLSASAPGGGVTTPVGGTVAMLGTSLSFESAPVTLNFKQIGFHVEGAGSSPVPKVEVTLSVLSAGGGYAHTIGGANVQTQDLKPHLAQHTAPLAPQSITGFAIGKWTLPRTAQTVIDQLNRIVETNRKRATDQKGLQDLLREDGIDIAKAFEPSFVVTGWASRMWHSARTDSERKELNQELSRERAEAVSKELQKIPGVRVQVEAAGPGVMSPTLPNSVPWREDSPELREFLATDDEAYPPDGTRAYRDELGPTYDTAAIRRVDIEGTQTWYAVEWDRPAPPSGGTSPTH
jgi:outer membrane protein OmpA-like peptidoglycan-associated protein